MFSAVSLCSTGLTITLCLICFSGALALKDIHNRCSQPDGNTVLALLICITALLILTVVFFLSGMLLGKNIPSTTFTYGWLGCFLGIDLFLLGKYQVSEKELEDHTLTYKNWVILFSSVGIGASSLFLFLP